ncbi:MliC family protein [Bartonella heixiaziensis]|uniref:MliC family protein n=1 Tax=Bartonella heixiaziensis TaxID=1461000 RepID=UPI003908B4FF
MKKTLFNLRFLTVLSLSLFSSMSAFAGSLVIEVPDDQELIKGTIFYQCSNEKQKMRVEETYYSSHDIGLVDLKWNGNRIIASNVIAASGAKYVGGEYVWWTKGDEASFYNILTEDHETSFTCVKEKSTE